MPTAAAAPDSVMKERQRCKLTCCAASLCQKATKAQKAIQALLQCVGTAASINQALVSATQLIHETLPARRAGGQPVAMCSDTGAEGLGWLLRAICVFETLFLWENAADVFAFSRCSGTLPPDRPGRPSNLCHAALSAGGNPTARASRSLLRSFKNPSFADLPSRSCQADQCGGGPFVTGSPHVRYRIPGEGPGAFMCDAAARAWHVP